MITGTRRRGAAGRRALIAALAVLALFAGLLRAVPAYAEDVPVPADRSLALRAWQYGGLKVRAAAEIALVGSDDQVRAFLSTGMAEAEQADERDTLVNVIADAGPSVRAAAQQVLNGGDPAAITQFLSTGWQGPADIDARVSVNQLLAVGGPQVREAAQAVLDTDDPDAMRTFLDSGWQLQWQTDQRLRVNQALATGGPQVRAAAQRALDAETSEAYEAFLSYGWAVASARDDEVATLSELLAQAQAAGEEAAQETQRAQQEGARAKEAAEAAKKAAEEAAAATEAAREHTEEAAAHAKRAAAAADKAAQAARVAVDAAAAASRAARAAANAASRAARAAAKAGEAATKAYKAAADAATDASKASTARQAAETANTMAQQARDFATTANQAGQAIQAGLVSVQAARDAAAAAQRAAAANDEAVSWAQQAGADASAAVAAANRARANADRALRAAQAAENYLQVAMTEAFAARDAALRAADDAQAAAAAAIDAADHAGEAAQAAQRATAAANAATLAALRATDAAEEAQSVYQAARDADAERLAVFRDEGLEGAQAASAQYEAQRRQANWDTEEATKRSAETNQLITLVQNPATDPAVAVPAARKVALSLASTAQGSWTLEAARTALTGDDAEVVAFVRTGLAQANAQDDRIAVMNLAVTDNTALKNAAMTALNGTDSTVRQFLRTQNYPGRYTQDRLKVNQILAAANAAGDVVLAQAAQAALDAETLQALQDFLDDGQYTSAAIGQRVRVNQIAAAGGPEVKAAAQIALDGPPLGLQEFLDTAQYYAAERDYEGAAHLAVVAGLLQKINQVAETANQNALLAQSVAAAARQDAAAAADYANQASASAIKAANYATAAQAYANDAAQSVDRAAAAVATAKSAATRAVSSARSAIKSASWAIVSQQTAIDAAADAHAAAQRAYDSAVAAGQDATAALAAADAAYKAAEQARGLEIVKCAHAFADSPLSDLESQLTGVPANDAYENCVRNVIADPAEMAKRAYINSATCDTLYPLGGQDYQNCIHRTLDPDFRGTEPLIFGAQVVMGLALLWAVPVGMVSGVLCLATVACAAALGTLLTLGDIGLNVFKLINGDQSLGQTLLNIGQTALENLLLAGVGKALSAGFRSLKALYVAARDARKVQAELNALKMVRIVLLKPVQCLVDNAAAAAGNRTVTGLTVTYSRVQTAANPPPNADKCRLVLGKNVPGEDLAALIKGYTYNNPDWAEVIEQRNGVPFAIWMRMVEDSLRNNEYVAVAMDGFRMIGTGTPEDLKRAYIEAYRVGYLASIGDGDFYATPWEMYKIGFFSRIGRMEWKNIDWYLNGNKVVLPEPTWVKDPVKEGLWWPTYDGI